MNYYTNSGKKWSEEEKSELHKGYKIDKLNVEELNVHKSNKDVGGLIKFMVNDIEMDELRVQKAIKKIQNTLGNKV